MQRRLFHYWRPRTSHRRWSHPLCWSVLRWLLCCLNRSCECLGLSLGTHRRFDLFQAENLPCRSITSSGANKRLCRIFIVWGWLGFGAPYAGLCLDIRYVTRILVPLVACFLRSLRCRLCTWRCICRLVPQIVPDMFFFNRIGDLRCLAEEIEVLAHIPLIGTSGFYAPSKSIIVEVIVGFFQLVAQSIVRVFKVNAARAAMSA
jgi:hypothetical protein